MFHAVPPAEMDMAARAPMSAECQARSRSPETTPEGRAHTNEAPAPFWLAWELPRTDGIGYLRARKRP
ncbi:hypothetical protein GCM10010486_45030 [Nonomuraea roseoviolacea subsp. carminata]